LVGVISPAGGYGGLHRLHVSEPGASFLSQWERSEVRVRSIATGSQRAADCHAGSSSTVRERVSVPRAISPLPLGEVG